MTMAGANFKCQRVKRSEQSFVKYEIFFLKKNWKNLGNFIRYNSEFKQESRRDIATNPGKQRNLESDFNFLVFCLVRVMQ